MSGKVYLIGAGPGDPELITMKAARCLAQADVVVYDFLANPELLGLAPAEAAHVYVGKKGGDHTMSQEGINALLCDLAAQGKTVARLKGGDPYVFGRGGEEASALWERGLAFEVVPGVSSAVAAPCYAGIPVTDRRHATEVAFVTGHEDPTKASSTINWQALAAMGSLVFLMGVKNLPEICAQLIAHGKPAETPAACVRWGATARQQTIVGALADLPQKAAAAGLKPPAVTIVGGAVALREQLNWYERMPLFGRRVLVTRARAQASKLSAGLRALGAEVVECPTIEIRPMPDDGQLRWAAAHAADYDWVLFTSANAVEPFLQALLARGRDVRALHRTKIGAIGPATAQALARRGLKYDLMAKSFVAEGLLEALADHDLAGKKVLLPRATRARDVLPEELRKRGALVDIVAAYETFAPAGAKERLEAIMADGLGVITFTASSTVDNLMDMLDEPTKAKLIAESASGALIVASIGPITSQSARRHGMTVHVEPAEYTIPALIEALAAHCQQS
ncbi:uroporphyrin-III C-methyltransferase [Desulfarculus baarsii DSM 2075]|uniref:uroporphyrinogen-III C-methyltransferase n=1 Tax=Desulfarculus baarsii (strain ATCC 33931 / DSM 2075 / LMG 7858 / VKM B-1802 / 2st14) TaxID=644282 RepID=E1QF50_DESB2|nr:uroporphyrinogen-III C-methyltransferase [Desulfarculus baarsii]ADK84186.1 uroporphyrin-III C-methyltransferase [Desulfarculus baarsii DSM 2075]